MTPYEPSNQEIELFLESLPEGQRPSWEEAKVFLRAYGNGDLDGLTVKEMTEQFSAMADGLSEVRTKMLKGKHLLLALENPFARRTAPVWEPIFNVSKRGKIDRRRAKNRVAKKSRKQKRGK